VVYSVRILNPSYMGPQKYNIFLRMTMPHSCVRLTNVVWWRQHVNTHLCKNSNIDVIWNVTSSWVKCFLFVKSNCLTAVVVVIHVDGLRLCLWTVPSRTRRKPVPVPLCLQQIPHGLTCAWTRASAVRGWQLTASAMAET
jgi:hypothetical protein